METITEKSNQNAAGRNTENINSGSQADTERNGFTAPVQDMAAAAKEYAGLRIDEVKINAVENMAGGFGRMLAAVLVLQLAVLVLTLLGLASILLLGELIDSYALAALIVALVFAVLAVIVFLTRKSLFVKPFGKALTAIFFKDAQNADINAMRERIRTERAFKEKELKLHGKYLQVFYSPANLFNMLSGKMSVIFSIVSGIIEEIYGKIKSRKAEKAEKPVDTGEVTEKDGAGESAETADTVEKAGAEETAGAENKAGESAETAGAETKEA